MMRKFMLPRIVFATLALCLMCVPAVSALEVVYPAEKSWVVRNDYLIVKCGTKPAIEGITIKVNDVASDLIDISGEDYRAAFGDMVILQPEWTPGKNVVEVVGFSGGAAVATARIEFYFLSGTGLQLPPGGFKRYEMHLPEKEKLCAPCHNMQPDKAQLSIADAATNPCGSCHRRMLERKYVHGPAGVFQCTDCHASGSQPARYRLAKSNAELCNECHFDKVEEYKKNAFVHGPVGVGLCITCHDPHASDNPAQLYETVNAVCLGCHSTVRRGDHVVRGVGGDGHPLEGKKDPSNPSRPFSCVSCHNPHGGASRYLFVRGIQGRFQLCQECHKK